VVDRRALAQAGVQVAEQRQAGAERDHGEGQYGNEFDEAGAAQAQRKVGEHGSHP